MAVKAQRQQLLTALQLSKPGLASRDKGTIPQAADFIFKDGRVRTYNDEVSLSVPLPSELASDLEGAVPGEALLKLLDRLHGDEIEVEVTPSEFKFKCGRSKAGVTRDSAISLPLDQVVEPKTWSTAPESLKEALSFAMFACARDLSVPVLTCVHVRPDGVVEATDNFRVTSHTTDKLGIKKAALIPADSVAKFIRYTVQKLAFDGAWFHGQTEDGVIVSARCATGEFPNIEAQGILKVKGRELQLPKSLEEVLDRVLVFSDRDYFLDERVLVTLGKKRMRLRAESNKGWVEEELVIRYDDKDVSFYVHPKFLKDMAAISSQCVLGADRMRFEGEGWVHVVALSAADR